VFIIASMSFPFWFVKLVTLGEVAGLRFGISVLKKKWASFAAGPWVG
jgi:hypothetical protein